MVDAKDGLFVESRQQNSIQRSRRGEIGAERLLHDDARALRRAGLAELLHRQSEQHWRNRQVVGRMLGGAKLLPDRLERGWILIVAVDIAQQAQEFLESGAIHTAVLVDAVGGPCAELIEIPALLCHADHRNIEVAAFHHRMQRREDLLVREIAGGAEKNESVGMEIVHGVSFLRGLFPRGLFQVSTELVAHRREQLIRKVRLTARAESLIQRRGQNVRRHPFVDRCQ